MELLRKVDLALNQAKNTGPGSILFYEAQMQAQVTTRARLQHDLREALQQESFCLHYQPQINAAGQVVGVEALVRWISKEHGLSRPQNLFRWPRKPASSCRWGAGFCTPPARNWRSGHGSHSAKA